MLLICIIRPTSPPVANVCGVLDGESGCFVDSIFCYRTEVGKFAGAIFQMAPGEVPAVYFMFFLCIRNYNETQLQMYMSKLFALVKQCKRVDRQ